MPSWNPWTELSREIPFSSQTKGVGDGEDKVASELGTTVLGQNSPYDMDVIRNGVRRECDVKKLDTQNDFNTGVKGHRIYLKVIPNLIHLFEAIAAFSENPSFTQAERAAFKKLKKKKSF